MKQILFYLIVILVILTSCHKTKNQAIVKGKFIGDIPDQIKYSMPVNGICYGFFQASEKVDSLGHFELRLNIDSPSFIKIFTNGKTQQLVVEPGENYLVTIGFINGTIKFNVDCENTSLQDEYQKLVSPEHPQMVVRDLFNSPISNAKNKIDSLYQLEVATFEKLSDNGLIKKELLDLILLDRKLFYGSAKGNLAMVKFFNALVKDKAANKDSINQLWKEAISSVPLNSTNLSKSKWAFNYIENYLMYHEYTVKDFSFDRRTKARIEGTIHTYLLGISKTYLEADLLEFYTSAYILSKARQNLFEKELITLFAAFKNDFPESKYTEYLEPEIIKIVDFNEKAAKQIGEAIKFIDNYENIQSFAECLQPFKGKKVYVDIWTTSCGPCKDEFKHSKELEQLLASNNIAMLYLSLDGESTDKRWKDMIKFYQLNGNHLRANNGLNADLKNILGSLWIPRYLLIDEKGKIMNNNARHPSELQELEKQLKEK